jgi:hypothetical protein
MTIENPHEDDPCFKVLWWFSKIKNGRKEAKHYKWRRRYAMEGAEWHMNFLRRKLVEARDASSTQEQDQ